MKIIIVGGGKIGLTAAISLVSEGHIVCVIDTSSRVINSIATNYDIMGICGNGALYSTQLEAGADKADLLVATTSSDELNILCCLVAKKIGVKHTIARVRNPEYSDQSSKLTDDLGITLTLNPELNSSEEISRLLRFSSVNNIDTFFDGRVDLVGIKLQDDSELVNMSLSDIGKKYHSKVLICAVSRGSEIFIPDGSFVLNPDDFIHICGKRSDLSQFIKRLGELKQRIRTVMLVGGGRMGFYLAQKLADCGMAVKLIDKDETHCRSLAGMLVNDDITIVCGDASNQEFLNEQRLSSYDAFVALTGMDEQNLIMSMFAKNDGVKKVIAKTNRFPSELMSTFGIDSVISPKFLAATSIIAFVRSRQVADKSSGLCSLHRLLDGSVEALEFDAAPKFKYLSVPLKDIPRLPNLMIAAILRHGKVIYPRGDDTIEAGDKVMVVTRHSKLTRLDDIIK